LLHGVHIFGLCLEEHLFRALLRPTYFLILSAKPAIVLNWLNSNSIDRGFNDGPALFAGFAFLSVFFLSNAEPHGSAVLFCGQELPIQ
jgi:hypothetical protein